MFYMQVRYGWWEAPFFGLSFSLSGDHGTGSPPFSARWTSFSTGMHPIFQAPKSRWMFGFPHGAKLIQAILKLCPLSVPVTPHWGHLAQLNLGRLSHSNIIPASLPASAGETSPGVLSITHCWRWICRFMIGVGAVKAMSSSALSAPRTATSSRRAGQPARESKGQPKCLQALQAKARCHSYQPRSGPGPRAAPLQHSSWGAECLLPKCHSLNPASRFPSVLMQWCLNVCGSGQLWAGCMMCSAVLGFRGQQHLEENGGMAANWCITHASHSCWELECTMLTEPDVFRLQPASWSPWTANWQVSAISWAQGTWIWSSFCPVPEQG